jgi:hypothetical protein
MRGIADAVGACDRAPEGRSCLTFIALAVPKF